MRKKTKVLLVGSFHFMEEKDTDLYSTHVQQKIDDMVKKMAQFNPDKIAIEAPWDMQNNISAAFKNIDLEDFYKLKKMKESVIGNLVIDSNV